MEKSKKFVPEFGRTGKMGTYTLIVVALMLAALIVVNLLIAALPSKYTAFDTSSNKMYTLSDASSAFVSSVNKDVTLYFICEGGVEDSKLKTFLERFADLSSKIKVKVVDPVEDSSFLEKHNAEDATNYSVVVESEARNKIVYYEDLNYYYSENTGKMDADTYSQYQSYYGDYLSYYIGEVTSYFDGDSLITGAIEYVVADKVPMVYFLEGHMEAEFSDTIDTYLFKAKGIESDTLNIALDGSSVPEDADMVIINAPANDLSADEAAKLISYLGNGGKIIVITGNSGAGFANLNKVGAAMGLTAVEGVVKEGTSSMHYQNRAEYIYADVNSSHSATSSYSSMASSYRCSVLVPAAHAIAVSTVEGVTATALLTTSAKATSGDSEEQSLKNLCVVAEKGDSALLWLGSDSFLSDTFVNGTNGGNFYLFAFMFSWMHGDFASSLPEISAIELSEPVLTVTDSQVNIWMVVLMGVVPAGTFLAGLLYWLHRRKK